MTEHIREPQHGVEEWSSLIHEHRYLQNGAYSRDRSPLPISVKRSYVQLKACDEILDFDEVGVGVYSQNNEDGILLYIFSRIGMTTKRSVEIGCDLSGSTVGVPEGNSLNLIINMGFDGLIVDIDADKVASIQHFFAQALPTKHFHAPAQGETPAHYFSPLIVAREVNADNINGILTDAGFVGELDLMSIDVDGPDLEIWQAVKVASPRVVVVEVNNRLPFDQPVYGQATTSSAPPETLEYQKWYGSSLAAACTVAHEKGYVFVGMGSTADQRDLRSARRVAGGNSRAAARGVFEPPDEPDAATNPAASVRHRRSRAFEDLAPRSGCSLREHCGVADFPHACRSGYEIECWLLRRRTGTAAC